MKYLSLTLLMLASAPAAAYIGPGLGVGVVSTVLAVIGALVLAVVGVVYYPLKRLIHARKARRAKGDVNARTRSDGTQGPAA